MIHVFCWREACTEDHAKVSKCVRMFKFYFIIVEPLIRLAVAALVKHHVLSLGSIYCEVIGPSVSFQLTYVEHSAAHLVHWTTGRDRLHKAGI